MARLASMCCGFALALLVMVLDVWGGLPWTSMLGVDLLDLFALKSVPQTLGVALALLASALMPTQGIRGARVACVALSLCQVCLLLPVLCLGWKPGGALVTAYSVALGAICGGVFAMWGCLVGSLRLPLPLRVSLVALILHAVLLGLFGLLPASLQAPAAICACLATCLLYLLEAGAPARQAGSEPDASGEMAFPANAPAPGVEGNAPSDSGGAGRRLSPLASGLRELNGIRPQLLCVCAAMFSFGFVRTTALLGLERTALVNQLGNAFLVAATVILLVLSLRGARRPPTTPIDLIGLYRTAFPALATLAASLLLFGSTAFALAAAALHALFFLLLGLTAAVGFDLGGSADVAPRRAFGALAGCAYLSVGLSTLCAVLVYRSGGGAVTVATVAICAVAVIYSLALGYAALQRMEGRRRASAGEAAEAIPDAPDAGGVGRAPRLDTTDAALDALATTFALSARERDVLALTVRGYSMRGMAKALAVSENTVRTHARNLYRKLGVHSRQEILELLDRPGTDSPAGRHAVRPITHEGGRPRKADPR